MSANPATAPLPEGWRGEPRLILFFIPTPVPLALPNGSTFAFYREEEVDWLRGIDHYSVPGVLMPRDEEADGRNFVSLMSWRASQELTLPVEPWVRAIQAAKASRKRSSAPRVGDIIAPVVSDRESYSTVLEAVTPLIPVYSRGEIDRDASVSLAFDRCVEHVGELCRAYILWTDDLRVRPITRRTLYPGIPWTTRAPLPPLDWGDIGVFMANTGEHLLPVPVGEMNEEELNNLMIVVSRAKRGDPVIVWAEHFRAAQRAMELDANYLEAVLRCQIATEVLFDSTLLLLAWEAGEDAASVAEWFERRLTQRVRMYFHERLGGTWDTTNGRSVVGRWAADVRDLRDRVVHRGYNPTEREAARALRAGADLERFVKERLASKRNSYPRTTLMVLGRPGLVKMGLYRGQVKKFAETTAVSEPDWWASYGEWAEAFQAARQERFRI